MRVSLGIVFIAHGYLKVFTFGMERAMEVFEAHTVWHIKHDSRLVRAARCRH